MATNGTHVADEPRLDEELFRAQKVDARLNAKAPAGENSADADTDLALAPLVDKIAYGIARGLVTAMKELEAHIASETRKVGESVGTRLDTMQASFQDLTGAVSELRAMNLTVQDRCEQLAAATTSLQETHVRQETELAALRTETKALSTSVSERINEAATSFREADARQETELAALRGETKELSASVSERFSEAAASLQKAEARQASEVTALRDETKTLSTSVSERIDVLCKELGIQQEDMAGVKSTLCDFSSRADTLVERLDRQADAVRSMYAAYAQRETELEQLVDGLARLRAYPTPSPLSRL